MKATNGHMISVHYRGTLIDGTEFDSSRDRGQPLDFELGSGAMIRGFNDAVVGMTVGETKSITLESDEAYGPINPEAFRPAPKEAFGPDFEFVVGDLVQGNSPEGQFLAKIHEIQDDTVTLNLNHPLAGEQLTFEINLMEIHTIDADSDITSKPRAYFQSAGLDVSRVVGPNLLRSGRVCETTALARGVF